MPLARLYFGRPRGRDLDAGDSAAHGYLAALRKNGQVHEYFLSDAGGSFQACAEVPRYDALDRRHASSFVREELKKAAEVFGREPGVSFLDRAPPKPTPGWRR